jgi:uncharacterized protein (DUF433 family)
MATVTYAHVEVTAEGVPYIAGTQTKVVEVILDRLAYHWDTDEIHRQHPHLTLSQIYSALAYYYDHQAEMDREIDKQLLEVEKIRKSLGESSIRLKLKAMGRLP